MHAANLVEEIPYMMMRIHHGWEYLALFLVAFHFALPFLMLLSFAIELTGVAIAYISVTSIGGDINKVIEGAKNIVKWKRKLNSKTPFVFFQFLVVKPNEHQVEEIKKLSAEIGVDEVRFKTAQIYDYENDPNQLIPVNEKFSRYKKDKDGKQVAKNKLNNHCWKLWQANVITWDGLVVPCCFDKDAAHRLGNLQIQSFKEIWRNDNYKQFRKELMSSRKNIDICSNCSEGMSVWKD